MTHDYLSKCLYVTSPSLFLSPSFSCPSANHHPVFHLLNLCVCVLKREGESSENRGGVAVDNVCKFVREHPVLCNKYTVLLCLLLCLFISFYLSPLLLFQKNPSNLHPPWFCSPSPSFIHPFMHQTFLWLTVVSCRETVNNLSGWVVLPCPALLPFFWLATEQKWTFGGVHATHTFSHHGCDQ